MGREALSKGMRYDPEPIAAQCAALFQELLDARDGGTAPRQPATAFLSAAVHTAGDLAGATVSKARRTLGALRRRLRARTGN